MSGPQHASDAGFALYASALAGKSLGFAWHEDAHGLAYSDGAVVYVARARAQHALVDAGLQALLVRQGSLRPEAMRRLLLQAARARSYLALELSRALASYAVLLPRAVLAGAALERLPSVSASLEESLTRARGGERVHSSPAWGCLAPARVLARQSPFAAAESGSHELPRDKLLAQRRKADGENEDSSVLKAFQNPVRRSAALFDRLLDELLERNASGRAAAAGGGSDVGASRETGLRTRGQQLIQAGNLVSHIPALHPTQTFRYPEWDEHKQRYRPQYVHVAEVEPHPDVLQTAQPELQALSVRRLQRSLAGLCHGYQPESHQTSGDELDLDALVRLRADVLCGQAPSDRIYKRSRRTRRDLGVLLLLDLTASTAEHSDGQRIFDRERQAAWALARALHSWGDRVSLLGFHSRGPKLVRIQRLLRFDERPDAQLFERLSRITPAGYSRLGAAIRHGSHALQKQAGTPQKLMVVVSDGFAYDKDYEGRYAQADVKRALAEARAQAVACVCLCIGASTERAQLLQTFGETCLLAVPGLSGYEPVLRKLFERAVAELTQRPNSSRR